MLTQIDPKRLRTSLASLSNKTPDSDTNTLDKTRCFFQRKKATSSLSWRPTGTTSSFTVYYCFTFTHTFHFASTDFSLIFNVLVYHGLKENKLPAEAKCETSEAHFSARCIKITQNPTYDSVRSKVCRSHT